MVFLGAAPCFVETAAQGAGLGLAAQHLLLDVAGPAQHDLGDRGQFADHFTGLGHLGQFVDMLFQRRLVIAGGVVSIAAGLAEFVDRAFQPLHQLGQQGKVITVVFGQVLLQPGRGDRLARLNLAIDRADHLTVCASQIVPCDRQGQRC